MELFTCPLCMLPLVRVGGSLKCADKHSFDLAREGYVNLLAAQHRGSKSPGDNPEMIAARRQFLDAGYYLPLAQALVSQVQPETSSIADLGCGDGYFTAALMERCSAVYGIDVSRAAIKAACRRSQALNLAVASSARLPFGTNSFAAAAILMAPLGRDTARVIRPGGRLYRVSAGADHLRQLKALMYPEVRPHQRAALDLPGFQLQTSKRVGFELAVTGSSVQHLIAMTPMRYRVDARRMDAARRITQLDVSADFYLDVFAADPGPT